MPKVLRRPSIFKACCVWRHRRSRASRGWAEAGTADESAGSPAVSLGTVGVEESLERKVSGRPGAEGADVACLLVEDGCDADGMIRRDW